jgi:hypothetical protein
VNCHSVLALAFRLGLALLRGNSLDFVALLLRLDYNSKMCYCLQSWAPLLPFFEPEKPCLSLSNFGTVVAACLQFTAFGYLLSQKDCPRPHSFL